MGGSRYIRLAGGDRAARQGHGGKRRVLCKAHRWPLSQAQDFAGDLARGFGLSGVPGELVRVLLAESLAAWRVAGDVSRSADGGFVISVDNESLGIEAEPPASLFRWMVTVDGRKRGSISL